MTVTDFLDPGCMIKWHAFIRLYLSLAHGDFVKLAGKIFSGVQCATVTRVCVKTKYTEK